MRKALIIALGLASLGAIASAQPAFSLASMQPGAAACRTQNIICNAGNPGSKSKVCLEYVHQLSAPDCAEWGRRLRPRTLTGRVAAAEHQAELIEQ